MVRKHLIDHIAYYAELFVGQVKSQSAMGYHDIGIHAEQALIPILNIIFDVDLKNVNKIKRNHPAIDLADDKKGIAFQITSTSASMKIMKTLRIFVDYNLYQQYPTLFIFIITEKEAKYKQDGIEKIVNNKFNFDVNIHIIDYRDVLRHINFIDSNEILSKIAGLYEQLSTVSLSGLTRSIQNQYSRAAKQLSYIDRVRVELGDVIGIGNIDRIPELPELLNTLSNLEAELASREQDLEERKKVLDNYNSPEHDDLRNILREAYINAGNEYRDLKEIIKQKKENVNALSQKIRHQKEFLDQIDQQQTSEKMQEVRRLFEEGKYEMVDALLNYEGRQAHINKKLEEKNRMSAELKALADEEVFLALSMWQKQDWRRRIPLIRKHFEQSIKLGGYG